MGRRRLARERAVQILYSIDRTGHDLTDALVAYLEMQDEQYRTALHHFTVELLETAMQNLDAIDERLAEVITNWQPERVAVVDRQILRLAVCELLFFPDIPIKVTLNEYIEVAKTFSGQEAAAFINGVLDRIARTLPAEAPESVPEEEEE